VTSEGLVVAAGNALAHRIHIHTLSLQIVALHPASRWNSISAGVVCSVPIVGNALGEVKRVLKPSGKVFFMEQVLAPDPDRKLRPYRLNILNPLQQANLHSCHFDRDTLSSTCSSNCLYGIECGRQASQMQGSIAIDISACKLQPELVTRRPKNRMGMNHTRA
jgi:hypothetical protein